MTTPLSSLSGPLGSRLLAGVGTRTLLATPGLFASRPAHTANVSLQIAAGNFYGDGNGGVAGS